MAGREPDHRESDEGLIRRILSGDEVAAGLLYDRYGGRVYSAAKHILQDSEAAEEILQDIFHQLWRTASSFNFACGSLAGWLLVMARSRSIDRLRHRSPAGEEEANLCESGLDLESDAARNELAERVQAALQALPEAQREAMELAYFRGFTQTEIAIHTGDPQETVKTRLRTALASLREELGK